MKTTVDHEIAMAGSEHRCEEIQSMDRAPGEGLDATAMDFDDWVAYPFGAKDGDVFSSLSGVVDEVVEAHSNMNPSTFVSEKDFSKKDGMATTGSGDSGSQICEEANIWPSLKTSTNSRSGSGVSSKTTATGKKKSDYIPVSRRKKKPKGMPKRPLSAYNLYFQAERSKIIANQHEGTGPRIGFEGLGKIIGKQWRDLSGEERKEYAKLAEKDSERYRKEMEAYHEKKAKRFAEEDRRAAEQVPVITSLGSSTHSVQASSSDPIFANQPRFVHGLSVGEAFGSSALVPQNAGSMVSAVSSLPPGSKSISYRPIQVEQAPTPSRHVLQLGSVSDALSRSPHGIGNRNPPRHYFPQPAAANSSEPVPYDAVAAGSGAAILSPNNNNYPMPPGMEVILADRDGVERKYSVQYTCYSMTRENANKYIESITRENTNTAMSTLRPWPAPPPPNGLTREYAGQQWDV